ncbi:unnamed protein product, partial [Scytosiphon promiscuus]
SWQKRRPRSLQAGPVLDVLAFVFCCAGEKIRETLLEATDTFPHGGSSCTWRFLQTDKIQRWWCASARPAQSDAATAKKRMPKIISPGGTMSPLRNSQDSPPLRTLNCLS